MSENHYMISDASKKVNVETHVLRYWEEELGLEIPRNDLGHRYYTDELIQLFCRIRDLKESGYQLKAIKLVLPKLNRLADEDLDFLTILSDEINRRVLSDEIDGLATETSAAKEKDSDSKDSIVSVNDASPDIHSEKKMELLQTMFSHALSEALNQQMERFAHQSSHLISEEVSNRLNHEISVHMQLQEEQQEEHFKKVDSLLRQRQHSSFREAALTKQPKKRFSFPWNHKENEL